jgi:hypothetical protein
MNSIKQKSLKMKKFVLAIAALLFSAATAILTALRPVTMTGV